MRSLIGATLAAVALAGCGSSTTATVTVTRPVTNAAAQTTPVASPGATSTTASTASPTATTTTISSTSSSSAQTPASGGVSAAPAVVVHYSTFASPSRNLGCMILDGTARCDIKTRSWSPPPTPKSCPPVVDYGQGLIVTASGEGQLVCAGDTVLDSQAQTLAYGAVTEVGPFDCASSTAGMTCTNEQTGHGFFISIQSYRTF